MNAVEIQELKKTFDGENYVLKGLNLQIEKGNIACIIGFSGTGKSVLLKHLLGLYKPSSGVISILGKNIADLQDSEMSSFRCNFGVLFQDAALFDDMSTLENVMFPINEYRKDLSYKERKELASAKLDQVGLGKEHFNKLPSQVSGGMRKRVGLARAIALDPDIILYDEPTTGLDPIMTEMVDDLILSTHRSRTGITSIVITHDLHAAFRLGDEIAMLDKGKVLLKGTAEDFFNTDIDLVKRFVEKGVKKT
ncbi:MAG: ATP-binding cassette domain-containing protein [Bdellovibrionota bacterium]|nr:ABC transporter ATP-binding protein [Pseudobdellovibrionaceae bacterium]|tara:strand:+ start:38544 stop:39296 length:753 start_codon:yes stop_codon:yes gene_type:complete